MGVPVKATAFAILFGVISFGASLLAAPAPKDAKPVNYFPIKEGSTWVYSQQTVTKTDRGTAIEVTSKLESVEKVKDTGVTKTKWQLTQGTTAAKTEEIEVTPKEIISQTAFITVPKGLVIYKIGSKVGDKWEGKIAYNTSRSGQAHSVVEAPEEIEIGAGKFRCVVVSHTIVLDPTLGGDPNAKPATITLKFWLAPEVGVVKRERTYSATGATPVSKVVLSLEKYEIGK